MGCEYDFDIVKRDPSDINPEPDAARGPDGPKVRALFRDVKAADALRGASPKIRKMFLDAGFDLDAHNSGIASGVYPPEDMADRHRILRALFENIRSRGLEGEYCGDFDFRQFLDHVRRAQPVKGVVRSAARQKVPPQRPETTIKRRAIPGRIGVALGLAVVLFSILKYLAAAGASP